MFAEYSLVTLKHEFPSLGLKAGAIGVVVHTHGNGEAYEVEFADGEGMTIGVITIAAVDLVSRNTERNLDVIKKIT